MAGHSPSEDGRLSTPYVPAIHAAPVRGGFSIEARGSAWMPAPQASEAMPSFDGYGRA
jgi:hypothetical protein